MLRFGKEEADLTVNYLFAAFSVVAAKIQLVYHTRHTELFKRQFEAPQTILGPGG